MFLLVALIYVDLFFTAPVPLNDYTSLPDRIRDVNNDHLYTQQETADNSHEHNERVEAHHLAAWLSDAADTPFTDNVTTNKGNDSAYEAAIHFPLSSFATLVNFGLDGRERFVFDMKAQMGCTDDNEIWDSTSEHCKQLHCSPQYELVDEECFKKPDNKVLPKSTPDVIFIDSQSKVINVTLAFSDASTIKKLDICSLVQKKNLPFEWQLIKKIAFDLNTKVERFQNVTTLNCDNLVVVNFLLLEDPTDVSNQGLIKSMFMFLNYFSWTILIKEVALKAESLHTQLPEVDNFCKQPDQLPLWYWFDDVFRPNEDEDPDYIYINSTYRYYYRGEFMLNLLFMEHVKGEEAEEPTASQVCVVCERRKLYNNNCPQIYLERDQYKFVDDGKAIMTIPGGNYYDEFDISDRRRVAVCKVSEESKKLDINFLIEGLLTAILLIVSLMALTCIFVTYLIFPRLRASIAGFNTVNLVGSLILMQIIFLTNTILQCQVAAIILHYTILVTLSWSR